MTRNRGKRVIPTGIVIPNFRKGVLYAVKMRRDDADVFRYGETRYTCVSGSKSVPMILNPEAFNSIFVVESELDAILLHQECENSNCVIALGGSNPNVDLETHNLLLRAKHIYLSLDNDPPGQVAARRLQARYPSAIIRPVPVGKDPGEAFQQGFNLKQWLEET